MSDLATLIDSIESSLADIAAALEAATKANQLDAIESALADMVACMGEHKGTDLTPLVHAIAALRPPVVNVPAPVVQVLPAPAAATWEITLPGMHGAPDRVMTVKRIETVARP